MRAIRFLRKQPAEESETKGIKNNEVSDMKVGLIYTSTTPELIADVEREVKKQLGEDVEMFSLQDPSILADVRAAGYVTAAPAARLIGMYMKAVEEGVDAMLNLCSSVGEVADCAQDAAKYLGVPIVRVDEEMCREAVRLGKRVGVMATLPTTLTPTKNTVARVAREMGAHVELVDCLVDGAFGLDQEQLKAPHRCGGGHHRQGRCRRSGTGQHGLCRRASAQRLWQALPGQPPFRRRGAQEGAAGQGRHLNAPPAD